MNRFTIQRWAKRSALTVALLLAAGALGLGVAVGLSAHP